MHLSLAGSRRTDPLRAKQIQKDVHWRARSYWRFRSFKNRTIPEEGLMTKTCFPIKLRVNEDRMGLFWIEWLQIKEWRWRLRWTFTEAGGLIWTWFEGSCTMKNRAGDPKINASSSGEHECATHLIKNPISFSFWPTLIRERPKCAGPSLSLMSFCVQSSICSDCAKGSSSEDHEHPQCLL